MPGTPHNEEVPGPKCQLCQALAIAFAQKQKRCLGEGVNISFLRNGKDGFQLSSWVWDFGGSKDVTGRHGLWCYRLVTRPRSCGLRAFLSLLFLPLGCVSSGFLQCEGVSIGRGSFPNHKAVKSPASGAAVPVVSTLQEGGRRQRKPRLSKSNPRGLRSQPAEALAAKSHDMQSGWPSNYSSSLGAARGDLLSQTLGMGPFLPGNGTRASGLGFWDISTPRRPA